MGFISAQILGAFLLFLRILRLSEKTVLPPLMAEIETMVLDLLVFGLSLELPLWAYFSKCLGFRKSGVSFGPITGLVFFWPHFR